MAATFPQADQMSSRRTFLIAGTTAFASSIAGCGAGSKDAVATESASTTTPGAASSPPPDANSAAADWLARSTATGVVVACDFSSSPANGGTYKWGSLKTSPHVTCYQQNDATYGQYVVVDTSVYPPGSTGSLRWDVPDCPTSGAAERGDLWWISIDDYADQFGSGAEFWVQWRTRMDSTYATFPFADRSGGFTAYKQLMCGEGMQPGNIGTQPQWPYGFRGPGTSIAQNQISGVRVDFEGETNLIGTIGVDATTGVVAPKAVFKYPSAYHGKPTYVSLITTDGTYFTHHNSGNEGVIAACKYQLNGQGVVDRSTCFIYPTDEWFTLMVHVKLGVRGHGLSSIPVGYQNVAAVKQASNQILLTASNYVEHFDPAASGGKYIRIRGTATGAIDAKVTAKDTATFVGQALLTLTDIGGTIANEALLVDEYENGYVNSTIEYYGAYSGGSMQLLHRKAGVVMRVGNYVNDATGYTPTAKYGTFAWTTFMTGKSYTQTHPVAKVWVSQIIIKSGPDAPAAPAF